MDPVSKKRGVNIIANSINMNNAEVSNLKVPIDKNIKLDSGLVGTNKNDLYIVGKARNNDVRNRHIYLNAKNTHVNGTMSTSSDINARNNVNVSNTINSKNLNVSGN